MVGSESNCTPGKGGWRGVGGKVGMRGEWDEREGTPVNILNKGLFRYTGTCTGFQYTLIGRLWHLLLKLKHWCHKLGMLYWGRETSVIESRRHRSYYKQHNWAFPVWSIFSWWAENLLESRSPRQGRFRNSSNSLWGELDFFNSFHQ